ncbi:hypothetical protein SARC_15152 [Sphaeroforma arctica JP610]|uniref:Uncharacterized protein n=1 Tax=Sphaeroforma arctica JP610 TaxID=667725 RepID=A0A0L0F6D0_9EUKA|nr:hypothetical protein SARC_15152 [Sphaeroforma arctica JP610]KNC72297.1 hypothetical protein SARC_15152 [Sphaeroforma arctica JP610]|eukprot:XP_014146199.1 hypothetical protein SARC_15152 [Sphaeroforma arctica JP610]
MRDVPYDRWCLQEHHEETTALSKAPAVSRFLLVDEFLQQFKYAYFGDVDIAWIKDEEKRPPLQSHKSHARRMGVPYSNVQRTIRQAICDKRM